MLSSFSVFVLFYPNNIFINLSNNRSRLPEVFRKKKVFLEISQYSHEITCDRVSFLIKLQASVCNFIKKEETLAQVFSCGFCEFFKNTFSYRTRPERFWNRTSGYLNKRLWNRCFLLNVAIFLRTPFLSHYHMRTYLCVLRIKTTYA